ncbi:hypothetical protein LSAT2_024973, partial [Lamellibrachia satsuma]
MERKWKGIGNLPFACIYALDTLVCTNQSLYGNIHTALVLLQVVLFTSFSDQRNEIDFRDPITMLKEYITQQGLRLIDFFKQLDEFVLGLKELNVPLTTSQLDKLILNVHTICDGEGDY